MRIVNAMKTTQAATPAPVAQSDALLCPSFLMVRPKLLACLRIRIFKR